MIKHLLGVLQTSCESITSSACSNNVIMVGLITFFSCWRERYRVKIVGSSWRSVRTVAVKVMPSWKKSVLVG